MKAVVGEHRRFAARNGVVRQWAVDLRGMVKVERALRVVVVAEHRSVFGQPNVYKLSCRARPAKQAVRAAHLSSVIS